MGFGDTRAKRSLQEAWWGSPSANKLTHTLHLLSSRRGHQPLLRPRCLPGTPLLTLPRAQGRVGRASSEVREGGAPLPPAHG